MISRKLAPNSAIALAPRWQSPIPFLGNQLEKDTLTVLTPIEAGEGASTSDKLPLIAFAKNYGQPLVRSSFNCCRASTLPCLPAA
jgi:hypothetical protein